MQTLTEQQILFKEDLFLDILEDFVDNTYEIDEDYEMTDQDVEIFQLMENYFYENFIFPDMDDILLDNVTGYSVNSDLFEEVYSSLLNDDIGKFIAGAVHGIRNFKSKMNKNATTNKYMIAKNAAKRTGDKFTNYKPQTPSKPGVMSSIRKEYQKSRKNALLTATRKANDVKKAANSERLKAQQAHSVNLKNTENLANKINTKISDFKTKAKNAITSGIKKTGGILGRASASVY